MLNFLIILTHTIYLINKLKLIIIILIIKLEINLFYFFLALKSHNKKSLNFY